MAVFVVAQMAYLLAFLHLCGGTVTKVGIRRAGLFWFFFVNKYCPKISLIC